MKMYKKHILRGISVAALLSLLAVLTACGSGATSEIFVPDEPNTIQTSEILPEEQTEQTAEILSEESGESDVEPFIHSIEESIGDYEVTLMLEVYDDSSVFPPLTYDLDYWISDADLVLSKNGEVIGSAGLISPAYSSSHTTNRIDFELELFSCDDGNIAAAKIPLGDDQYYVTFYSFSDDGIRMIEIDPLIRGIEGQSYWARIYEGDSRMEFDCESHILTVPVVEYVVDKAASKPTDEYMTYVPFVYEQEIQIDFSTNFLTVLS